MIQAYTAEDLGLAQKFKFNALSFSRNRSVDATVLVQFGDTRVLVRIRQGGVTEVVENIAPLSSWDFSICATTDAWIRFWQALPVPGSHDIFALAKNGEMAIEGNLYLLMTNLQYMKDLFAVGREARA